MILQSTPLISPWTRGAIIFFMYNSLSIFLTWMVFDIAGRTQDVTGPLWVVVAAISLLLYLFGIYFTVKRLKFTIIILGVFVALPGLIFCITPTFLFAELAKIEPQNKKLIGVFYFLALFFWCVFQAKKTIHLERKYDYLRKNIRVRKGLGFFYPDSAGMLSAEPVDENFTKTKLLSIITPIVFLGYPMQRLISDVGGSVGFFGVIAVLTIPMSVYLAGKISAGFFLWIYLAGNFEARNNVKIFLR